jgi:hypothetical protein
LQANALLLASGIEFSSASGIACQRQLIQGVSLKNSYIYERQKIY